MVGKRLTISVLVLLPLVFVLYLSISPSVHEEKKVQVENEIAILKNVEEYYFEIEEVVHSRGKRAEINPIEAALEKKPESDQDRQIRLSDLVKQATENRLLSHPPVVPLDTSSHGVVTKPSKEGSKGKLVGQNCFIPTGRKVCAPNFIVAGSMKCGTTSMYAYLTSHPKILGLNPLAKLNGKNVLANKEVRFWLDPTFSSMSKSKTEEGSVNEYLNLFYPIVPNENASANDEYVDYFTGEATPMYVCQTGVAQRIYKYLPEVKIIIMARNPIDRAYSELWFKDSLSKGAGTLQEKSVRRDRFQNCLLYEMALMQYCQIYDYILNTTVPFTTLYNCVTSANSKFRNNNCDPAMTFCNSFALKNVSTCPINNLKNSLYAYQAREWYATFPKENILYIKSEDFYSETPKWMKITQQFIGMSGDDEFKWETVTHSAFNIVNPGTSSAEGMKIVSGPGSGLKVGETEASNVSDYPEMDASVRETLSIFFDPLNRHLADVTGLPLFWEIENA